MHGAIPATPVALTGADQAVATSRTTYRGITVRETAGAVATVRVFDNASAATGTLLDSIALAAGASLSLLYVGGLSARNGVYVDVTGAVEGSVRIA
jgi:hypothetical protein